MKKWIPWILVIFITTFIAMWFISKPIITNILNELPPGIQIVASNPMEMFNTILSICFLTSLIVVSPLIILMLYDWAKDALYEAERKKIKIYFFIGTFLFLLGAGVTFYGFVWKGIAWLIAFTQNYHIVIFWSIEETINLIITMMFLVGICFETPIVLYLLIKNKILELQLDDKKRMYLIVGLPVIIGIITPDGSFIPQLVISAPIYILIEASIYLGNKHKQNI